MLVPCVLLIKRLLEIAVAPDEDIDRERPAVPPENLVADRACVPDADAAAHNEEHVLILRYGKIVARRGLFHVMRELFVHRDAGDDDAIRRNALFYKLGAQILVRDEVAVQIGLGEEGDAGVVRQHAVARHGEIPGLPDRGQRLHRVEVRAYHTVVPVCFDECAQICGVPGVCVVDRRGDAGRAVNIPGAVKRVERRRRFFHNCRIGAGYEALGILSGEHERVKDPVFDALSRQRPGDGGCGAVMALARVAAQNQNFHGFRSSACFM